ncbi:hypothetical protein THAOC_09472 [Thalassiosira oceanica]|uniref:Uncharacterized protein n=1 Tax=Thalassiosira oceanica TaxID=159749 RepID=K0SSJ5_THAOC|nr:hypothetical protein THAOC_09472 [Thalassiosira oceanica]|eukprot:EJK69283.1 hypothetical protein THAOC_09472 [Thalassiosira oceanica]
MVRGESLKGLGEGQARLWVRVPKALKRNHRKTVVDDVQGVDGAPLPRRGVNSSRQRGRAVCSSHRSRRRRGTNPRPRLRRGGDTSEVEPPHPPNLNGPGDPGVAPESPNKKPPVAARAVDETDPLSA